MKILTTSTGTQRLRFIPRTTGQAVNVKLTDKNTRVTTTTPSLMVYDDGYSYIDASFTLKEGTMYDLEIEMITQFTVDSVLINDFDGVYSLFNLLTETPFVEQQAWLDSGYDAFYRLGSTNFYLGHYSQVDENTSPFWLFADVTDGDPAAISSKLNISTQYDVTNLPSDTTWKDASNQTDTITFSNVQKEVIYRDTVFCTDQTDYRKYTVNQGEYTTENTYDNDFIVL